jgi:hypothetical protein
MCFSKEASLIALVSGIVGSALTYSLGRMFNKIIALFLGFVSLMQGIEFLLWSHQTCDSYHKNISLVGSYLNTFQPIALAIIVLLLNNRIQYPGLLIIVTFLYSLYLWQYIAKYTTGLQCTTPRKNNPHLVWNWLSLESDNTIWWAYNITLICVALLGMPTTRQAILFSITLLGSLSITKLVYERQGVGSVWCYFTALFPFAYYIFRKLGDSI